MCSRNVKVISFLFTSSSICTSYFQSQEVFRSCDLFKQLLCFMAQWQKSIHFSNSWSFWDNSCRFRAFCVVKISLPVQDGHPFETPSKFSSHELFAAALYQLSINTLKTSYLPNFMLVTEGEQFPHTSAQLYKFDIHSTAVPSTISFNIEFIFMISSFVLHLSYRCGQRIIVNTAIASTRSFVFAHFTSFLFFPGCILLSDTQ